jgi:hypothetical protein
MSNTSAMVNVRISIHDLVNIYTIYGYIRLGDVHFTALDSGVTFRQI